MTIQVDRQAGEFAGIVRRKAAVEVAQVDYRRELKALAAGGHKQTEIARALHISQPAVSKAVKVAAETPDRAPGFSGAGPYEICQRYAAGLLPRERLVDELSRWAYAPIPRGEWFEDPIPSPGPGSWREVEDAVYDKLIDDAIYEEALVGKLRERKRHGSAT